MRTRYKCSLAALAITVAIVSVYASVYRYRSKSFEKRFTESFSKVRKMLSSDPDYIYSAEKGKLGGFTTVSCPNRLRGLDPNNPLLEDVGLDPLHVNLGLMPLNKLNVLGRVVLQFRLPTGHWLKPKPRMLHIEGKVIVVAASNPSVMEMETLVGKLKALGIDSDIPITLYPNGHVSYGRNITFGGG